MITIQQVKGKGRGVIATKRIASGVMITSDPVIVLSRDEYAKCYKHKIGDYAFAYGRRGAKKYAAIALGPASLLNHADTPNCYWHFDSQKEHIVIYTVRTVSKGEELTISYGWPEKLKARKLGKKH